ncbi:MAG: DUF4212 domain-containing protein [Caldilineae bacterium]|nr:MAG: DUF4212 domain-containing protein [Caldilineae bacterium]
MSEKQPERNGNAQAYWKANVRLIITLLVIWGIVSYLAAIILAKPLYNVHVGQIPMSYWFAQQGSMFIFVILIFIYAWRMNKIDREHDVHEE